MVITNLEYTNDFRKILENDIDIYIRLPRKPCPTFPPYPQPIENPRPPVYKPVQTPLPLRNPIPDEVVNGRTKTREPVPKVVIVENRKPKIEKEIKERRKIK